MELVSLLYSLNIPISDLPMGSNLLISLTSDEKEFFVKVTYNRVDINLTDFCGRNCKFENFA